MSREPGCASQVAGAALSPASSAAYTRGRAAHHRARVRHLPERLWEVFFFDEDYARGLYERMRLTVVRRELQREGEGPSLIVRRKLQLAADRELPGALKRLFQGTSTVTEVGEFNAALRRYSVTIQVPVIGNLVDYGGEYTWETLPSGQLRRVWRGHCDARIPWSAASSRPTCSARSRRAWPRTSRTPASG
ncbi:DUF2505 family protein [Nannocystis pusilla]|uniref:DUF2505 family protein n=1 Tax=Nannocystis pusilla TaxID=889268 RepID=UPI003B7BFB96